MKILLSLLLLFVLSIGWSFSQEHDQHHEHARNEFGIGFSPVYFINENSVHMGLHTHYVRKIQESRFGLGFNYEHVFDEHKHNTYGFLATYNPAGNLNLSVSPGLTFEHDRKNPDLSLHFETMYEFDLHYFHLGPVFEAAFSKEDVHLSLGLHIGFGF